MARRDELVEALDAIETGMCRVKESREHLAKRSGVCPVSGGADAADG